MKKKKALIIGCSVALIVLIAIVCWIIVTNTNKQEESQKKESEEITIEDSVVNIETVKESEYYKVERNKDWIYTYYIYNKNKEVVKTEQLPKEPHIEVIDNELVVVTVSAGPQLSTTRGYFFNVESGEFSETYYSVFDQYGDKVAYRDGDKIIVRDIFNKDNFYMEISEFKEDFSQSTDPILSAVFEEEGTKLKVTYHAGVKYSKVEEVFDVVQ